MNTSCQTPQSFIDWFLKIEKKGSWGKTVTNLLKKDTETKYKGEDLTNWWGISNHWTGEYYTTHPTCNTPFHFVRLRHCEAYVCHCVNAHTHQWSVSELKSQMQLDHSQPSHIRFSPASSTQHPRSYITGSLVKETGKLNPAWNSPLVTISPWAGVGLVSFFKQLKRTWIRRKGEDRRSPQFREGKALNKRWVF